VTYRDRLGQFFARLSVSCRRVARGRGRTALRKVVRTRISNVYYVAFIVVT
jgi:hypothetical protein